MTAIISIIVAVDKNWAIGIDNKLPWHLPADLKRFKQLTTGRAIIMGRKTYESIGKPLPNRLNIIISRSKNLSIDGCEVVSNLDSALKLAEKYNQEVFIIGGSEIFDLAQNIAHKIYLTKIDTEVSGADCFFPKINESLWELKSKEDHLMDEKNKYPYHFLTYVKK